MVSTNEEVLNQVNPVEVQLQQQQQSESAAVVANGQPITDEEFERAQKLFQLGKKNLFLNKYDESVNNIGDACKVYAAKYGEMDPKLAEVYFFYGRSLLELARVESTVLGNALTGVPEEEEQVNDSRYGNPDDVAAEEKNEIAEKVIDALCSGEQTEAAAAAADVVVAAGEEKPVEMSAESVVEKIEVAAAAATTEVPKAEEAAAAAAAEAEEEDDDEEDDEEGEAVDEAAQAAADAAEDAEEDVTNLQSSWEMFELAKVIYTKHFEEDAVFKKKRIAECLLKLGEISVEQETYEQAITDITESVRVQEELASGERDERMLAESYYQLGLARQFNNQLVEADEAYQRSINIVQLRVEKLRGRLLGLSADETSEDVKLERASINDEIAELELLLPEMTSKLEEVKEQDQQTIQLIREAKECFTSSVVANSTVAASVNGGDVKDITSLVKSKRKNESGEEDGATKKTRLSNENGEEVVAEAAEVVAAAVQPIEVDENKENNVVESAVVCMEEGKEQQSSSSVEEQQVAAAVEVVAAEPVATA